MGLYFAEVGAGVRGGLAVFDRGHAAAANMQPTDEEWPALFAGGCQHFHAGGIFPVLGPNCAETLHTVLTAAKAAGVQVSYDLNYRASLCAPGTAARINQRMVALTDVLIGSVEGFTWLLAGTGEPIRRPLAGLVEAVGERFPNLKIIAGTCRTVRSGSRHDLAGFVWQAGQLTEDPGFSDFEIVDRVGTGDAFSAGLLHGFLRGWPVERSLRFALAHAVLVHTTRGDTSQFSEADVVELAGGGGAAMRR